MKRLILILFLLFISIELSAQYDIVRRKIQDQGGQVYNVKAFGAKGNGTTDDGVSIRKALDSARANGGGIVYVPNGTYKTIPVINPLSGSGEGSSYAGLFVGSNTKLILSPNATIKRADSSQTDSHLLLNIHMATGDSNITIEGGIWDGNGANNPLDDSCQIGIGFYRVFNSTIKNLIIKDIRGNLSYPPGESFNINIALCNDISVINVICEGSEYSSSGFAYNGSTNITTSLCKASDFGIAIGFTQWYCSNMIYNNCVSYNNKLYGFNTEQSSNTIYSNCIGGGIASYYASAKFASSDTLGNLSAGFAILGTEADTNTSIQLIGCIANYNTTGIKTNTPQHVRVVGGEYSHNSSGGISLSTTNAPDFKITGEPYFGYNGDYDIETPTTWWNWTDFRDSAITWNTVADTNIYYDDGSVGIQTNSPQYSLDVGDGAGRHIVRSYGGHGDNLGGAFLVQDGTTDGWLGNMNVVVGGESSTDDIMIKSSDDLRFWVYGSHSLFFITGEAGQWDSKRLTIDSSGRFYFHDNNLEDIDTIYAVSLSLSGAPSYGSPLTVASGGTGASTLTGLLKGNGTGAVTAITAGTSAQFVRGDFTVQDLNQAAITGLSTSDTPTFEGVIVGGSATATAGSIKYSGGHLYFYNGAGWVQLAEETP